MRAVDAVFFRADKNLPEKAIHGAFFERDEIRQTRFFY